MQVKGLLLAIERDSLRELRASGRPGADAAWRALPEDDRRLLDGELPPMRWFPLAFHERLLDALRTATGGDRRALAQGGRRAADRLLDDAEERGLADCLPAEAGWSRVGPLLVVLPARLLSETSWRLLPGDETGRFAVEVLGAQDLSEGSRELGEALLAGLATRLVGRDVEVRSERPGPDTLRFLGRPARR